MRLDVSGLDLIPARINGEPCNTSLIHYQGRLPMFTKSMSTAEKRRFDLILWVDLFFGTFTTKAYIFT